MRSILALSLVLAVAAPAAAQDRAAAEAAFREGKKLMKQRRFADACPKLEASQRLDPALGTLLNLADCYAGLGRSASAWAAFVEVGQKEPDGPRGAEARRRAAELEPRLARITVAVAAAPPDLRLTRDGTDIGALAGVAVPVDPGPHVIAATAAGQSWSRDVTAVESKPVTVEVPPFWRAGAARAPEPVPQPPAPSAPEAATTAASSGTQRTVAIVTGAAGLGAIAVGLGFGLSARSAWNESRPYCNAANECVDPGFDLVGTAQSRATAATVLVGAGAVAVAAGAVLWFTAPRAPERVSLRPTVGPGVVAWTVSGQF